MKDIILKLEATIQAVWPDIVLILGLLAVFFPHVAEWGTYVETGAEILLVLLGIVYKVLNIWANSIRASRNITKLVV